MSETPKNSSLAPELEGLLPEIAKIALITDPLSHNPNVVSAGPHHDREAARYDFEDKVENLISKATGNTDWQELGAHRSALELAMAEQGGAIAVREAFIAEQARSDQSHK